MKSEITQNKDATVLIKASLSADDFNGFRAKATKHLGEHTQIDGFRKGSVPEDILTERLGETAILTHMAEMALDHHYPILLREHAIEAIGQPQITITKLAPNNPLEVTITTAILPEISLDTYKQIAKDVFGKPFTASVSATDIDKTILEIRKQLYRAEHEQKQQKNDQNEHTERPEHTHKEPEEKDLPVIDDAQAQKMGEKDFAHFKEELKNRMELEEGLKERDRRINMLIDLMYESAQLTLPDIVIEAELARMMAEMRANIEQMGIKFDQYLTHIKKTEDELKAEHRYAATKRAASHLILKHIAKKENISVTENELEQEVARLKKIHPSASTERIKSYVHDYLENQAVIVYLEKEGHDDTTSSQ